MYTLCCKIKIGNTSFTSVHEVSVKRSLHNLASTAIIKLPVTALLRHEGEPPTRIETAKAIYTGDPVEIRLGYNGIYNTEFKGYVRRLNYTVPVEIECEDELYRTRSVNVVFSKKETTLKQCLNTVLPSVSLAYCTDLTLRNFVVNDRPGNWLLGHLKSQYGLCVFFDMEGRLYVGRSGDFTGETVRYRFRCNVIKDDGLKYQKAKDVRLEVRAICYYKDGTRVEGKVGEEGGEKKTLYYYDVKDAAQLKLLAGEELKRYSYDGYTGKIETFLFPYAAPCMVAELQDTIYAEREGNYLIESTEVRFGASGVRRIIEIGIKV